MFLVLSSKDVIWAPRVVAVIRGQQGTEVHLEDGQVVITHLTPASLLRRGLIVGASRGADHPVWDKPTGN